MRSLQSLDELIARKAAELADHLRAAAAIADKEEEIRIEAERQLAFIEREAGVKLEKKHEFTIAQGRVDSVYTRVIIEYKNPSSAAARIGPGKDSPGCKKVVDQLKGRFHGMAAELGHEMKSLFGVGCDGNHFAFVRFRDGKWDPPSPEPVEVTKSSCERFLWALFNLGQKGKPFSPEYIENLHDIGKIKIEPVQAVVEADLVYPLLRGRDVISWQAHPSVYIILTQDPETRRGIAESDMKRQFPKTFAYLRQFETQLRKRSGYKKYFKPSDPFYCIYNVGSYTLTPCKVVWRDMGTAIQVAVAGSGGRPVCPEHHTMAVAMPNAGEAHYLCGTLMSSPAQLIVTSYTTTTGISTHVLDHVHVPKYKASDPTHAGIVDLSRRCHKARAAGQEAKLPALLSDLDKASAKLWGITEPELSSLQGALDELHSEGRTQEPNSPEADEL